MPKEHSATGVVVGALVGGAVGAIAALLLAPKSGQQLRADIGRQLHVLGDNAKTFATNVCSQTKQVVGSVGTHTKEWAESVSEHTKDSTQAAVEGIKADVNSMAPTEQDMVKLGKEMEAMPTAPEVKGKGQVPDPAQ
ncbi:YtxH domain-containing protein [Paenibacillus sp. GCM10027627]|uniref:YtxH domain-containing protein n=1 Tax=unclassified Paenibacillus TaxID=185978 RepID=UPI00363B51E5